MRHQGSNFEGIFFKNEYRDLSGQGNAVIKRLILLLTLTFVALGFAIGGLKQLKERMDNPFTNWVDLPVNPRVEKQLKPLREHFSIQDSLDKYHLGGIIGWSDYHLSFHHKNHNPILDRKDSLAYIRRGRTIDFEGDLFREIINPKSTNVQYIDLTAFDENRMPEWPCAMIVTSSVMSKLGYEPSDYPSVKFLSVSLDRGRVLVYFKVLAIVEKLPSLCDFITTNRVYGIVQGEFGRYLMKNSISDSTTVRLMSFDKGQADFLKQKATTELGTNEFDLAEDSIYLDKERQIYTYILRISPDAAPTSEQTQAFLESCKQKNSFADYSYLDCGDDAERNDYPHNITFSFKDLDKIRDFQKTILTDHDIELMMEQVESRENFRLVTRLTTIIGTILFGFGLLSILLFLGNLINSHILKIKPNLGTFKAMGLENSALVGTYVKIILKLLVVSLSIALPIALTVGWLSNTFFLKVGFSFLHWSIPVVVLLVFTVTVFLIRRLLNKMLTATPGDLIYERLSE